MGNFLSVLLNLSDWSLVDLRNLSWLVKHFRNWMPKFSKLKTLNRAQNVLTKLVYKTRQGWPCWFQTLPDGTSPLGIIHLFAIHNFTSLKKFNQSFYFKVTKKYLEEDNYICKDKPRNLKSCIRQKWVILKRRRKQTNKVRKKL